ncbi:MAG: iron-containing alcohol dehydrogenase [Oscillospiraceae bacterium]|jgi:alcohol dehydrogenase YqhD (iron-dependent ADH family)|nr:iron-containing alcohol dehydrogenase [Oscillospiraceae bacterium]
MLNFDFQMPTRLVFGRDTQQQIGTLLRPYASRILLHYGGGSIRRSGLYDQVTASLRDAGIAFTELGGVVPNPRLTLVREGIALCRREGIELILAVGGGSAIDSAKAIAMGVRFDGDVWDIFGQDLQVTEALPVATVLTIPAAGSELSNSCVITKEETQQKIGHTAQCVRPVLSILNPELFQTLPKNQIAYGVADMMSHIMERYFTNTLHTDVTDELCEGALRAILKNAPKVLADPADYDAWCEIGWAGAMAHNDILGVGREQDWACHGMEHELSAIYDIPHGAGLAVLTPAWMRYVYRKHIPIFLQFAQNVMGIRGSLRAPEALIAEAIDRLEGFFQSLGLPVRLTEVGIGQEHWELMAQKTTGAAYGDEIGRGFLEKLHWQDVINIFRLAK